MSTDLTDAIEALAAELWYDANPDMPIRGCDAWQECIGLARRALNRAAPLIEASVRAKVAEEIEARGQAILRVLLEEHLVINGKCYPSHCGDPDDHIWSEHIAEIWRQRVAGAIARQHATRPAESAVEATEPTPEGPGKGETHNDAQEAHR